MATSGTNYTGKWTLSDGVLNLSPLNGNSGSFRTTGWSPLGQDLTEYITLTQEEIDSVTSILFNGSLTFYRNDNFIGQPNWVLSSIKRLHVFPNLDTIDVSGLDTSQYSDFRGMFSFNTTNRTTFPTILRGLDVINTNMAENYTTMFDSLNISNLDISNFKNMNNSNVKILDMFRVLQYCSEITLPSDFNRKDAGVSYTGEVSYRFGLARYRTGLSPDDIEKNITITNENGISVSSDEDFFSLPASEQGGKWTRDLSGLTPLTFSIDNIERSESQATIEYSYNSTSSVEVKTYIRVKGATVYPTTPVNIRTLPIGTSSSSYNVELPTDDAYEIQIVADDGNIKLFSFGIAESNILLLEIDEYGNMTARGDIASGGDLSADGNVKAQGWAGFIQMFAGATAPSGWLFCDGREVAVADYPLLYAVIGDTYGTPSDSDHFLLPDLRGRTPIGAGQGTGLTNRDLGDHVGAETHKLKGDESGQKSVSISSSGGHTHSITSYYREVASYGSGSAARPYSQSGSKTTTSWASIGSDTGKHTHSISASDATNAHNNMQPSLGINFIICTGETS